MLVVLPERVLEVLAPERVLDVERRLVLVRLVELVLPPEAVVELVPDPPPPSLRTAAATMR